MSVTIEDKDHGWDQIKEELEEADEAFVEVGVLSDQGTWASGSPANLADIASFNEFGAPGAGIPSRPFMRKSFDRYRRRINRRIDKLQGKVLDGKMTEQEALTRLGVYFQGRIQKTIKSRRFKRNSRSTIRQKGSSNPLIDTGRLRQSINFKVTI